MYVTLIKQLIQVETERFKIDYNDQLFVLCYRILRPNLTKPTIIHKPGISLRGEESLENYVRGCGSQWFKQISKEESFIECQKDVHIRCPRGEVCLFYNLIENKPILVFTILTCYHVLEQPSVERVRSLSLSLKMLSYGRMYIDTSKNVTLAVGLSFTKSRGRRANIRSFNRVDGYEGSI